MRAHDDLERSRPDGRQPPAEILDGADVVHLVQDDVDRHLAALFRGAVGVAHELDEQECEEQGRQELQGGVLIVQDDVIGALAPARFRQVDVGAAGDPPHGLALEHLESGAKAQDDACAHGVAGLAEQAVRPLGRMADGQPVKEHGEFLLRVLGEHLIDGGQVPLLRRAGAVQVHIKDQALEQVALAVVPEVVALLIALRVGDDHVGEDLGHECVAAQVKHAVPGVAVLRLQKVIDPHLIAVLFEQLRRVGEHLRLWIRDHYRLAAPDALEQGRPDDAPGLHGAAGAEDGDVLIEPGVLRQADDGAALRLAQDDPLCTLRTGHLQHGAHLLLAHPAGCAVGAPLAAGEVAGVVVVAPKSVLEPYKYEQAACQHRRE